MIRIRKDCSCKNVLLIVDLGLDRETEHINLPLYTSELLIEQKDLDKH